MEIFPFQVDVKKLSDGNTYETVAMTTSLCRILWMIITGTQMQVYESMNGVRVIDIKIL